MPISLGSAVQFAIQHKEPIKNLLGVAQFASGLAGLCNACYSPPSSSSTENSNNTQSDNFSKLMQSCAKMALIFTAFTSRPGQASVKWGVHSLIGQARVESFFGPTTNFAGNWKHPRHVFSILTFALGVPVVLKTFFDTAQYSFKHSTEDSRAENQSLLSNRTVQWLVTAITLTSRPALHLGAAFLSK